jgi:IS5 family transposase
MGQRGFWDEEDRMSKIKKKSPTLHDMRMAIDWEAFLPLLLLGYSQERKSNAGRKPIDPVIMFRMLILQQLYNLSDEELEIQVNDRRSFEDFIGLGVMDSIPDATTVSFFRERLIKADVIEELFETFDRHLRDPGFEAKGGQIIDATFIPVPKQRNTREENQEIKNGKVPESFKESPDRLRQKDTDAQWAKKNNEIHYGYKNSIGIDREHGFIRKYEVTPADKHDSQMLPALLDPTNDDDFVFADSAYAGKIFEELLEAAGFESFIHEKGHRNHPLSDASKAFNHVKSKIRALVEHVFGGMAMCMGGTYTRVIGLRRVKGWWGLKNLTYNMLRFTRKTKQDLVYS